VFIIRSIAQQQSLQLARDRNFGENILCMLAGLGLKTRSRFCSWSTPCIKTVGQTADNILDPNTTLILLAQPFQSAQSFEQRYEDGDASGTPLKRYVKIRSEVIEITILKF